MNVETLDFVRVATEAKDNANGLVYVHNWATGFQQLIFASDEEAGAWIKNVNDSKEVA